jgi:IstB-like ATP binding protein
MLTSNRPVEDWGKLIGDTAAVTAMLDCLLHHAHVLKCEFMAQAAGAELGRAGVRITGGIVPETTQHPGTLAPRAPVDQLAATVGAAK